MPAFLVVAGLLALAVLAIALRPLWRGTPALAVGLAGLLAVVVMLLYRVVGTPGALDPAARRAPATLADAIGQLEAQLRRDPSQAEGWRRADGPQPPTHGQRRCERHEREQQLGCHERAEQLRQR